VARIPPKAKTGPEGERVTLAREEGRRGLPEAIKAGERYVQVVVEKRIVGEIDAPGLDR
jgi:hypothetical protein